MFFLVSSTIFRKIFIGEDHRHFRNRRIACSDFFRPEYCSHSRGLTACGPPKN